MNNLILFLILPFLSLAFCGDIYISLDEESSTSTLYSFTSTVSPTTFSLSNPSTPVQSFLSLPADTYTFVMTTSPVSSQILRRIECKSTTRNPSSFTTSGQTLSVVLENSEIVICRFRIGTSLLDNTGTPPATGSIIFRPSTASGTPSGFLQFNGGAFEVLGTSFLKEYTGLSAGAYPWKLLFPTSEVQVMCNGTISFNFFHGYIPKSSTFTSSIDLAEGETVICTFAYGGFASWVPASSLSVKLTTSNGTGLSHANDFDFTLSGSPSLPLSGFSLDFPANDDFDGVESFEVLSVNLGSWSVNGTYTLGMTGAPGGTDAVVIDLDGKQDSSCTGSTCSLVLHPGNIVMVEYRVPNA